MTAALIGHTGFVGTNLQRQAAFAGLFNRANIDDIEKQHWDLVVCAAPSAVKWRANKFPEDDRAHVGALVDSLRQVRCERFVLISTVDVFPHPNGVDENTPIDADACMPYGRHRWDLECAVRRIFGKRAMIARLSQLFGPGLRKNFVYDLIWNNALDLVDRRSRLQFYDVSRLWNDLHACLDAGLDLVHLAAEPLQCDELARQVFERRFDNETSTGPVNYDLRSVRLGALGLQRPYVLGQAEVLDALRRFVADHQTQPPNETGHFQHRLAR